MSRLAYLLAATFICMATMGQMTCSGTGEESPTADPQGGSVAGNPDSEWGGSHAGNPEGGSVAQNPVGYRIIKGYFDTVKSADGLEACLFETVVLVNDELEHVIADVDAADCSFESPYPVGEPMALVGTKGNQQEFAVGDLDAQLYRIIGPGPAVETGAEAAPIDLGRITENPVSERLEPQFPIKAEDLIVATGDDGDGDGIPDAYDDFNNDWYYGYYEPGQLIANVAEWADESAEFCPEATETLKVQVKKWIPKADSNYLNAAEARASSNGVELVIHYKVDGKDARERTFGTIGIIEAGFIKTNGNKYVGDDVYTIECRGWLTHEDPHPSHQLTLRIGCYYRAQNSEWDAAACVYWDYTKMMLDLESIQLDNIDVTQPVNQVPINQQNIPVIPAPPSSKTSPIKPYVFP